MHSATSIILELNKMRSCYANFSQALCFPCLKKELNASFQFLYKSIQAYTSPKWSNEMILILQKKDRFLTSI